MEKQYYVYIVTNKPYGTLYTGVTSNLIQRIHQHREGMAPGFSKKHGLNCLVWYEIHQDVSTAISREKTIKKWRRDWKVFVIQEMNPGWNDLYPTSI
jgi:putative endonuclease